ncbi:MAG TPA: ABC transporter permease [Acidimicrobiia bacterium]
MTHRSGDRRPSQVVAPLVLALAAAVLLLLIAGANPVEAFRLLLEGSVGSGAKVSDTLTVWVHLALASTGLVATFSAGLWNIGIEGQIIAGAIAASWVAREAPGPGWLVIAIAVMAGAVGGVLWALLAGILRTRGGVNEIFGGLGLDFVAAGLAVFLIIGPWKREGIASTSGTDLFRREVWLPTLANQRLSLVALGLGIAAIVFVYVLMRRTRFGLRLRAVGSSERSAFLAGVPAERYILAAFAVCGALAGIAGTVQAIGVHHKLVPSISGGFGFLGILVVLLAGFRAAWIGPIALFFVMISVGSTQLQLQMGLDSALGGVLQGIIVLFVLLVGGWQRRARRQAAAAEAASQPVGAEV